MPAGLEWKYSHYICQRFSFPINYRQFFPLRNMLPCWFFIFYYFCKGKQMIYLILWIQIQNTFNYQIKNFKSIMWIVRNNRETYDILTNFMQLTLHKKWSFRLRISSVNMTTNPAESVTFTEEIFNGKLHLLCSVISFYTLEHVRKPEVWGYIKWSGPQNGLMSLGEFKRNVSKTIQIKHYLLSNLKWYGLLRQTLKKHQLRVIRNFREFKLKKLRIRRHYEHLAMQMRLY